MIFDNVGKDKKVKSSFTFTTDQENTINGIIDFIAEPFSPTKYIVGLTGPGGTGKTFVTNYIITHCKYSNSVIKCASTTHKACRVFSQAIGNKTVDTIQSTFGLRLDLKLEDFDPNRPQFNPMAKPKLDNIKVLIIDESSMVPAKLVTFICNTCKKLEIKIIFIGDPFQLAPVNETKSIAFDRCYKVYNLKEIVRQAKNNPITGLLDTLRYDIENHSYKFLEYISSNIGINNYNDIDEGFSICNKNSFIQLINNSFSNEEYTKNIDLYRIIGYTNNCISGWNNYIRNNIIKNSDKSIITKNDLIMSYKNVVNEFMECIINNSEEYIINDIVDYVDDKYGFKGFLVKFQAIHGGNITTPLFIIDHKDKFTMQQYYNIITNLIYTAKNANSGTRVNCWKEYYKFKNNYFTAVNIIDKVNNSVHERDIDYGFSITAHKSQGSTYNTVFVDANNMVYNSYGRPYTNQNELLRRLYVACSRASKELVICYGN